MKNKENKISDKKIEFYHIKYKNRVIFLGYCNYENFKWVGKVNGKFIICISKGYSKRSKSIMLHKYIKKYPMGEGIEKNSLYKYLPFLGYKIVYVLVRILK